MKQQEPQAVVRANSDSHRTDTTMESNSEQLSLSGSNSKHRNSTATTARCSSACLSPDEIRAVSNTRSIMIVRTQEESLQQSLDKQLEESKRSSTVSFGQVQFREFAYRPGDNPGGRSGVALTIDWECQNEVTCDLEAYEESRPPRRERSELNIPPDMRLQMLKHNGYSRGEIMEYTKMVNIARGQRQRTSETLQLAGAQEFAQKVFRGVLNKTVRSSKKKKERNLIRMSLVKDQQLQILRNQLTQELPRWNNDKTIEGITKQEGPSTPTDDLSDSSYDNDKDDPWVEVPVPTEEESVDC